MHCNPSDEVARLLHAYSQQSAKQTPETMLSS